MAETPAPATVGMVMEEVDTPALLVDLDAFERNLKRMADAIADSKAKLRPHSKTHKCPVVALRQMAYGAVGVCCQKVGEAEAMVYGGVPDVLVSNQIVGAPKLARLAALARQAKVRVCVDDAGNVADLNAASEAAGVTLDVLVEIDVGAERCGVGPGAPALALAQVIDQAPHLKFGGLQAYHGRSQHIRAFDERRSAAETAVALTKDTVELLAKNGLACDIVGGAGTGTYQFEAASGVYSELQAGSYVFMDVDYGKNQTEGGGAFEDFENSLFVYATVMSRVVEDRAMLDAGLKALSVDSGMPALWEMPGIEFAGASDEHGKLLIGKSVTAGNRDLKVGDKVRVVPGHVDPTVNLYDWYVGIRNGQVESLWPITARGLLR
jgi:3-hydroxy-D-aspartate aldolase